MNPNARISELEKELARQSQFVTRMLAQSAVTRLLASATGPEVVKDVLRVTCERLHWAAGAFWTIDRQAQVLRCADSWAGDDAGLRAFLDATRKFVLAEGMGLPGRIWESGTAMVIEDIQKDDNYPRLGVARAAGLHGAVAFPVSSLGTFVGVLEFYSKSTVALDSDILTVMNGIAMQVGQHLARVRAEEAQRLSEASFELLAETAPDPILSVSEQGTVIFSNAAVQRVLGYGPDELAGNSIEMIVPPEYRAAHRTGFQRYVETRTRTIPWQGLALPGLHKDGSRRDLDISFSEFVAPDGRPVFVGFMRDVTDRRALESELKRKQEHLELALDAGNMGTWEWMIDTGRVEWSPNLERLHRRAPGSFPGTLDAVIEEMHPRDRDRVAAAIQRALDTGQPYHVEYRITPDAEVRWLEAWGRVIYNASGKPQRMIGVCADVTQRHAADR